MKNQNLDSKAKRRFYLIAFVVAFCIDFFTSKFDGGEFKVSLIGLAVMITAALFFLISLIRDR